MPKLRAIGPQPPTEPGWYWVDRNGVAVVRVYMEYVGQADGYRLKVDDGCADYQMKYFHTAKHVWQPVAKPEME